MNRSSPLGPLENEVMEVMWEKEQSTVREVVDLLRTRRPLAYTTVMTVMNNLVHKGLLDREPEGKAYRYHVTLTQKAFRERAFRRAIDEVLERFSDLPIARFIGAAADLNLDDLQRLRQLITEEDATSKNDEGES
jgi:predicted transcriptional regulator